MSPGTTPNLATTLLQTIVGERPAPIEDADRATLAVKRKLKKLGDARSCRAVRERRAGPSRPTGTGAPEAPVPRLRCKPRRASIPQLRDALDNGLPAARRARGDVPLRLRRSTATSREGLAGAITESIDDASFTGLFDSIAAILAPAVRAAALLLRGVPPEQGAAPAPRDHRPAARRKTPATLRVGLFTDTFDEVNGVARFLRDMGEQAQRARPALRRSTRAAPTPRVRPAQPQELRPAALAAAAVLLGAEAQPPAGARGARVGRPPAVRRRSTSRTPGPMGLCGWLVAKMLRVPLLGDVSHRLPRVRRPASRATTASPTAPSRT